MTPADLFAWQQRLGLTDQAAADHLGISIHSYRDYLPRGRRRRDGLPGWVAKLTNFQPTNPATAEERAP